jgi:hypothetical protein
MVPQMVWQRVRWTGTAALALLASVILAPGRAEASCGDYVKIGGGHTARHGDADRPASETPAVPRCHGPACSNNSMPPAAPVPKMELPIERWALSGAVEPAGSPFREPLLADAHDIPRDGCGLSILRPPR